MNVVRRAVELITTRRNFGLLMGTQFAAQAGDGIVQAALAKLIVFGGQQGFDLEGARSPDELLRIALYVFVPYTVLSPFLGVVIDHWDRRRLLFLANALRGAVVGLIALVGTAQIGEVALFLAFLLTLTSTRIVLATKAAALPETLLRADDPDPSDDRLLVGANGVSQLGGALFQLGGAGAAVVAAQFLSIEPIVAVGAAVYAAGAVFPLLIRRAGEPRAARSFMQEVARVVQSIVAGVREVARTPRAGAAISTYFWLRLLWSFSLVGIGFIARVLLAGDDMAVLILTGGAGAVGAALGFLMQDRLHSIVPTTAHLVLGASTVAGVAVLVLGSLEMQLTIAALAFWLGFGFFLAKISLDTLVQEALGDDFRGRAFSLYDIAYNLAWVLAAAAMKIAWAPGSSGRLVAAMGLVFLVGLAALGFWYRRAGLLGERALVEAGVRG